MSPRRISLLATLIIVLGGAVALATPTLFPAPIAQMPKPSLSKDAKPDGIGWLTELNLTPEQTQKVRAVRRQYKDAIAQQRQASRQADQELRNLMKGSATTEQIRQQYGQVKTLRAQLADTEFESFLATREILTVEQRQKFAERMETRRKRFRDRSGDRSNDRPNDLPRDRPEPPNR
jgi:Spy/CpxP family protein refolding chaperone